MSTYLILGSTVGLGLAIPCVLWARDAYVIKRRRERELKELRRRERAAWERTLASLQSESADRQRAALRLAAR